MATQQQNKQEPRQEHHDSHRFNAEISKHVMETLGQPGNLFTVQVRPLWDDRYRVNVYVGPDLVNAKVAHSYFLLVDGQGKVVTSTPKIKKMY